MFCFGQQETWLNQYFHESIPDFLHLSTNFVTMPYRFGPSDAGYVVRVISTDDDTVVNCPELGISQTVISGDFLQFNYPNTHGATKVTCTHSCLVSQYSIESRIEGGPSNEELSGFMIVLTPEFSLSDDVTFNTPGLSTHSTTVTALSITTLDGPVDDLWLNEQNLADIGWSQVQGENHMYATMELSPGSYRLYTNTPSNRYIYSLH